MIYFIYDRTDRGNKFCPIAYCTERDRAQNIVNSMREDVSDYARKLIYFEESGPDTIECWDQ